MTERSRDNARLKWEGLHGGKRLLAYYWKRTKQNRLAVAGLAFILFLIALALVGPFFTLLVETVARIERDLYKQDPGSVFVLSADHEQ